MKKYPIYFRWTVMYECNHWRVWPIKYKTEKAAKEAVKTLNCKHKKYMEFSYEKMANTL